MAFRVVLNLDDPLFDKTLADRIATVFNRRLADVIERMVMPRLRAITPSRTGNLQRSLRSVRTGTGITLGFGSRGFYWYFVSGLEERYLDLIFAGIRQALGFIWQETLKEAIGGRS